MKYYIYFLFFNFYRSFSGVIYYAATLFFVRISEMSHAQVNTDWMVNVNQYVRWFMNGYILSR